MSAAKALPVLMYHHVSPEPGLVTLTPEHFSEQMTWLAENGYHTANGIDLENFLSGAPLPAKSVMITFDDGYLDNYVHAYPVLKRFGLHAVVFAVTDWLQDGPARPVFGETNAPQLLNHRECSERIQAGCSDEAIMRWSEAERAFIEGVFEFHSHTASHTRWDKISTCSSEKAEALANDLARSRDALHKRLGVESSHLCWPQGYYDNDYLSVAQNEGFSYLYTTRPGTVKPNSAPTHLPRIVVKNKGASWLASRVRLYRSPLLSSWYRLLKGG